LKFVIRRDAPPLCYNVRMADQPSPLRRFQFVHDASHRLALEMPDVTSDNYAALRDRIVRAFSLKQHTAATAAYDVAFCDYVRDESIVGIEWDNWSGLVIVAKNSASEALVRSIAEYLQTMASE
jgi:hypothetical protein